MKGVALLLLLTVVGTWALTEEWTKQVDEALEHQRRWVRAAEDIMAHVVLGPLQEQLKGAAFSQRNRTQIITVQTNHLRAHVMQRLLQSLEEDVRICAWPTHVSEAAVQNIVRELKTHEFAAEWVPDLHRCPGQAGYIRIQMPLPAFE